MHEGRRKRLRYRFREFGIDNFAEHEALELMLYYVIPRADTNPLAHALIDEFGSFSDVLDADFKDLLKVKGVGENVALFLKLFPQVFNYYSKNKNKQNPVLLNSTMAGEYAVSFIGERIYEVFVIICLDAQRKVLSAKIIDEGTVSETFVHPRKVAEYVLRENAHSVIIAHNHPSGTLHPSEDDLVLTKKLCSMFEYMGIPVIDHIIVANGKFASMADRGLLP